MATSLNGATLVNPRYYSGPKPLTVNVLPTDSVTYKAGQPGYYDANGKAEVCSDDPSNVQFYFANTRATAATATYDKVHLISPDTKFVFMVVDGTTATAASQTMVGQLYSMEIISNVGVLDLDSGAAHSNDVIRVDALLSDVEPKRHAIADAPGFVIGHIITTASTDVNAA